MKTMRCEQCASTDLLRVGEGEYVCNHCTARMLRSPQDSAPKPKPALPNSPVIKVEHSLARRVLSVVLILAAAGAVASLRVHRSQRLADERRRRAIQRNISSELATRFGNRRLGLSGAGADARVTPTPEYSGDAVVAIKPPQASFTDIVALPDSIGNIYFIGIYKNTGEVPIDHPRVEATLWDADKHKLAVAQGYASAMQLLPGQEIPLKILAQRPPQHDSVTYRVEPQVVRFGKPRNFDLHIEKPLLQPDAFRGYRLVGSVTNQDKDPAQHVHISILLLGSNRQIVGLQEGYVAQRVLPAGDTCPFDIRIVQVHGKPTSFKLYTHAMLARD